MEQKFCKFCGKELVGRQKSFCSDACASKYYYSVAEHKDAIIEQKLQKRWRRKIKLIDLRGGKCEICGYNKNLAALEFHHVDPKNKGFLLDSRNLIGKTWSEILEEFSKCKVLCSNCHKELHNQNSDILTVREKLKDKMDEPETELRPKKTCKVCGKQIRYTQTYCSKECRRKVLIQRELDKNHPSKEELLKKYNELGTWEKVSKFYNLSVGIIKYIAYDKRKLLCNTH